ncbi:hypothetical protein RWV98_18695 [Agathobaculum sp. NTUH-O15-33]|uniref:hypothetical protein n=1 Tax=Agathobaculum sp. NTUH-O15-33 TaxID=3079302 RepID=UPI00295877D9|nr:hypothetical protein [Agathobaculum sp. NTUH-O15-33]WNX84578.1 hypothetical protein RWV98_18695 [Agathobaculum sp. NTUH-O15-33]
MSNLIKINYVNKSMNRDMPKIFLFLKNEIPTFDCLHEGVAWKVIDRIGRGSSCAITYPIETMISASWNDHTCKTKTLISSIGSRYVVEEDETGITIAADGTAGNTRSIDVSNNVHVGNGVSVDLYKDGKLMMTKQTVAYGQKATFVLHPKLYWGVASEIQEGDQLSSAVLNSDSFFEQNLEGVSEVTVALYGNAEDGYTFKIEDQK